MYCKKCGNPVSETSRFCPRCGTPLTGKKQENIQENIPQENIQESGTGIYGQPAEPVIPDPYPETVSEGVPDTVFETVPETVSEDVPDTVFETGPKTVPEQSYGSRKSHKTLFILIGAAVLVVILAAVIIPVAMRRAKQKQYDEASSWLKKGEYDKAQEAFESLGGFEDASDKAEYAEKWMEYDEADDALRDERYSEALDGFESLGDFEDASEKAAQAEQGMNYEKAVEDMEAGRYSEALDSFEALKGFKDAGALALKCQQAVDYESAAALYEAGDYEAAGALYESAGDYEDAQELAEKCSAQIDYAEAKSCMEEGKYVKAADILQSLDADQFPDRDELLEKCENEIRYFEAHEMLDAGFNYDAYKLFKKLGDFRDSKALAESCKVTKPATGETYRNSAYKGSACDLVIKPPTGDGSCTYLKVYTSDGIHVSSVFINAGDKAKIKLPAGDYILKSAYGYGDWFGETDMFGDEGNYEVLKVDYLNEVFSFQKNYEYTLSLRCGSLATGDDVPTERENRKDF